MNALFVWLVAAPASALNPEVAVSHWGYLAVFVLVILGNAGVPVPEETVLLVAGFLVWTGQLRLDIVLAVGVFSAVAGDNIGFWLGRRFGRAALERHAHWILGHPERLGAMQRFVARRGAIAVIIARFLPGLRFMAGPLAGALGFPAWRFFVANVTGALIYVPIMIGAGWAVGYGLGDYLEPLRRSAINLERVAVWIVIGAAAALLVWRVVRALRGRPSEPPSVSGPSTR
ncbi:MAG TPA: DedA family protein [Candidatus Bathyarchaeia archaeon]|nr:DedA family protein [Candidatus Bathyarchaeia archaeon]